MLFFQSVRQFHFLQVEKIEIERVLANIQYYSLTNRGVGGMNEGLQILLLGILFQRLHHSNTKVCTKYQLLSFWWLAPENSE